MPKTPTIEPGFNSFESSETWTSPIDNECSENAVDYSSDVVTWLW